MKEWSDFENQDVANLLSGISYTVNRLKNKLSKKDYEALAGDVILLKNKLLFGNRHSRYEDVSDLIPIIINKPLKSKGEKVSDSDKKDFLMITFDFQELKELLESKGE